MFQLSNALCGTEIWMSYSSRWTLLAPGSTVLARKRVQGTPLVLCDSDLSREYTSPTRCTLLNDAREIQACETESARRAGLADSPNQSSATYNFELFGALVVASALGSVQYILKLP